MSDRATGPLRAAWVGIGSNLGDREASLVSAVRELGDLSTAPVRTSSIWASPSVGGPAEAPEFRNMVAQITTAAPARRIVADLLAIEARAGRERSVIGAPRTLDLDLLWIEGERSDDPEARVPHPRLWQRSFVLAPLAELAPDLRCRVSGRTVTEALAALPDWPPARRRCRLPGVSDPPYNPAPGTSGV